MKILIFFWVLAFLITGCKSQNRSFSEINGITQGTTYHIVFESYPDSDVAMIRQEVESLLAKIDNSLSIYNDSSVISMINSNRSDQADTLLLEVLRQSGEVWEKSSGAFDITVGPLVKSWGFGPDAMKRFDETKRDSLMELVGMQKLNIEGNRLIKSDPDMFIDVNAIAQGYTVDLISRYLKNADVSNCLVEVGGEVRASGDKDGKGWRIGIDRPADGNYIPGNDLKAVLRLKNISLATSGNYRRFYVDNGIKYSHTIDPRTGYPARHTLLSATILASDCSTADAWATACMVVGKDSAMAFIELFDFIEGYLIYSDEKGNMKTWMSDALKKIIEEN